MQGAGKDGEGKVMVERQGALEKGLLSHVDSDSI